MTSVRPTDITQIVNSAKLLKDTLAAITTQAIEELLLPLPIVPEGEYRFKEKDPSAGWQHSSFV